MEILSFFENLVVLIQVLYEDDMNVNILLDRVLHYELIFEQRDKILTVN